MHSGFGDLLDLDMRSRFSSPISSQNQNQQIYSPAAMDPQLPSPLLQQKQQPSFHRPNLHIQPPSSPSDPPPAFLDLTLATTPSSPFPLVTPKLEPKLEPLDVDLEDLLPLINPNPSPSAKPESSEVGAEAAGVGAGAAAYDDDDPLPLSAATADDLFAALQSLKLYLRPRRLSAADDPLALAVVLPPRPPTWRSKPQPRSQELVRVSADDPRDRQRLRDAVRRARATYETLRTILSDSASRTPTLSPSPRRGRADLDAAAIMSRHSLWLNRDRRVVGPVPGVLVGDIFFFRMELCVVGVHGQVQAGIDYVPASRATNGEPIATSIVVSGGYEDDEDTGDVIVYTGHGGRERNLIRQSVDQKLENGNLALERSLHYGIEIRVVRGFKYDGSPSGRVYVYDGLYKIVQFWKDLGKSGFSVFKYKLVRLSGQDPLGSVHLRHAEDLKEKLRSAPTLPAGYLSPDLSRGKETVPVALFNDIDSDQYPLLFDYLPRPAYPPSAAIRAAVFGCSCTSNCSEGCACAERNGGGFAYDAQGILLMGKPLIYECGAACGCPPTCRNRVTQRGIRTRLEVFRSLETGWGVRSLDLIRAGSFVCEYSGIVLTKPQAEVMSMSGDSLVHPNRFPNRWFEWGDVSAILPENPRPMTPPLPRLDFAIDVSGTRNVACYLSQSSSPNVFLQLVLFDHHDVAYPHLMIFAMENIPPLRELSIDYGVDDTLVARSP